ncbi:S9 family peptidase [Flavobacterium luminosum]|uniref:Prolyl oligopeptidase family serine peptidase n=1 Tax=Flavobacterium luminosum TaxID=2949086 RepID=A0ABT0TPD3_9FLAO|nr:prolyl oligopeptidase family serine peptidase [Flavobacterium sp. HXWNR70]MCL9808723.1 prolyl oligopeptidase family serine peptidase [Flavobacterium sp. HXWNR70]
MPTKALKIMINKNNMIQHKITAFFVLLTVTLQAQQLQLEQIMKGEAFVGSSPENPRWSLDGQKVYFDWNPKNEPSASVYFWQNGLKAPKQVTSQEEINLSKMRFLKGWDSDTYFFTDRGAVFQYKVKSKTVKKLYYNDESVAKISLSSDKGILFLEQKDNIIKMNLNDGSVVKITNFKKGQESKPKSSEGFLNEQQSELFQFIRDQKERKAWMSSQQKNTFSAFPKSYYFNQSDLDNLSVHPQGKFVTFSEVNKPEVKSENMEVFITDDGYNQSKKTKAKVSVQNFVKMRYGIYNVAKDTLYYLDFSKLSGINQYPEYYKEYEKLKNKEPKAKDLYIDATLFNEKGNYSVIDVRSQDNKDRWLLAVNLEENQFTEIDHQHDEAWIGGPGIPSYSYANRTLGFLADDATLYFQSEATGYSHLYTYHLGTKSKKQLTSGQWEVRGVTLAANKNSFYVTANKNHPGNREFYSLTTDGKLIPILTAEGAYEVKLSPDEKTILARYSYKNKPWELYVGSNMPKAKLQVITDSQSEAFKKYPWHSPEVISFKAQDGNTVFARIYQPTKEKKNNAAVIFVHGAGYLQNAHNYWSTYLREYMFHNLLIDKGYTVLDIDYRASDGYGRDHRTGIYRFMGGKDLSDHLDGKKVLVDQYGINPDRVGIYGGSYGGFITLMAMLNQPKEFKAGAALRSVTDWAHYNHGYTGNILNFPETDPIAYQKSSPIYFAENLEGHLLMLHGMVDDNVEYKDIVRLSQRFIELGKKNWTLASYPVEAHGFKETYSWVDEYSRILDFFETHLKE